MNWQPISEEEIWEMINASCKRMNSEQSRLWETIQISPEKWQLKPWGDQGNGFWVVAIIGDFVVWYNDIEDGFNLSKYESWGKIKDYWCNQDKLEWAVQRILDTIKSGIRFDGQASPSKSNY